MFALAVHPDERRYGAEQLLAGNCHVIAYVGKYVRRQYQAVGLPAGELTRPGLSRFGDQVLQPRELALIDDGSDESIGIGSFFRLGLRRVQP
jgi:hypothetical protein